MAVLSSCLLLAAAGVRPSFVFLFLDDMRLDDMVAMPKLRRHITARGTNVTNFFVNTPVCCPSRATLLSGRYPHNNRVRRGELAYNRSVVPCCMHMDLLFGDVRSGSAAANPTQEHPCSNPGWWRGTLPVRMRDAGYNTGIFGKLYHMGSDAPCGFAGNTYGPDQPNVHTNTSVPFMLPGWDRQYVYCYPLDQYFWNRFLDQTTLVGTKDAPEHYATSLLGNKTVEWLRTDAIPRAKQVQGSKPFFAYVPLHPPHGKTTPAPWYNESWPEEWGIGQDNPLAQGKQNYGYLGADHHWLIAHEPAITASTAKATARTFVQRLQMLMSADDVLDGVVEALEEGGVRDSTYLMFCADHGWNLGEFRVMNGKHQMYEHTIRVPFAISGPGVAAGREVPEVMAMVDILPTILELAGADSGGMDGRSFAPILLGRDGAEAAVDRSTMMVEFYSLSSNDADEPACAAPVVRPCFDLTHSHSDVANNTFIGLRIVNSTHDWTYAEYTDVRDYDFDLVYFHELYDVAEDPFQLTNLYYLNTTSEAVRGWLHAALRREFECSGTTCQW